jgi:hypothetical protein
MYSNETSLNLSVMQSQSPSRLGTALGAIIAFLFIIFGLVGDFLILISILTKRELRNNLVNIFIVSLQLNDIFNISFNQLMVGLGYVFMKQVGPHILCQIFVYTSIICSGSLLWHHALISIHRYLVVVCNQNNSYLGMSSKVYVLLSLIIARLIPILVCAPAIIAQNSTEYNKKSLRCMLAPNASHHIHISILLINICLPCIIVILCFAKIFAKVRQVSKNIRKSATNFNGYNLAEKRASLPNSLRGKEKQANKAKEKNDSLGSLYTSGKDYNKDISGDKSLNSLANSLTNQTGPNQLLIPGGQPGLATATVAGGGGFTSYTSNSMYREIQITKMFAIIFTVFLFGYLPYGTIRLFDKKNNLNPDVYIVLTVLFIISISVSPIIYGLMNTQIRVQCVHLLRMLFKCNIINKWDEELYANRSIMPRMSRISSYQGAGITFDINRNNSNIDLTRKNSTKLAAKELKAKHNALSISVPALSIEKNDKSPTINALNASMKRKREMQKEIINSLKQEQPLLDKKVAIYDEKNLLMTKRNNLNNQLIKECASNESEDNSNQMQISVPQNNSAGDNCRVENKMLASSTKSNATTSCNTAVAKPSIIKKSILDKFRRASTSITLRSSTKSLINKKSKDKEKKSEHSLTNDEAKAFTSTNKNFSIQRDATNSNSFSVSTNSNSNSKKKPIDDGDDGGIYKGP